VLESWSGMKMASSSWEAARECGAQHLCLPVGDALRSNEGILRKKMPGRTPVGHRPAAT
jgi:hypothetical protein